MAISRAASQAEAAIRAQQEEAVRRRAARQVAANLQSEAVPEEKVECTVLPMGDGRISMGSHAAGVGEAHYEEGETLSVALPIAVALYDRGFVNFENAKQASADARAERARQAADARAAAQAARDAAGDA